MLGSVAAQENLIFVIVVLLRIINNILWPLHQRHSQIYARHCQIQPGSRIYVLTFINELFYFILFVMQTLFAWCLVIIVITSHLDSDSQELTV